MVVRTAPRRHRDCAFRIQRCATFSLLLICQAHSRNHDCTRSPSRSKSSIFLRRQQVLHPMIMVERKQSALNNLSLTRRQIYLINRGGATMIGSQRASVRTGSRLWHVLKSYWYLGILAFGGTPTLVALLHNYNPFIEKDDSFLDLVALMHGIPGSTSLQIVLATAIMNQPPGKTESEAVPKTDVVIPVNPGNVDDILAGLLALVLYTAPGFVTLTMYARQCNRTCAFSMAPAPLATLSDGTHGILQQLVRLLPGISPVTLAWTLQKSVIPTLSKMDGLQRFLVVCCCGLGAVTSARLTGSNIYHFLVIPSILALSGCTTLIADTYQMGLTSFPSSSPQTGVIKTSGGDALADRAVERGPTFEDEVMRGKRGFGSSPVRTYGEPDPFDFLNNLDNVAEQLEAMEEKFDRYLNNNFVDDLQEVDEYTEYFTAAARTLNQSIETVNQEPLTSSYLEDRRLRTLFGVSDPGADNSEYEPNATGNSRAMGNKTSQFMQQETRGGSIELYDTSIVGGDDKHTNRGVRALVLWLVAFFATTFIHWDNELFKIFAVNYRMGSSVLGGGPGLLSRLAIELIPTKTVSEVTFFHGARLAQSLPGSMFNVAAYLGALQKGWKGAVMAHLGMTTPAFLLVLAIVPHWHQVLRLRQDHAWFRSVLRGVTAGSVGFLCAVCVSTYGRCIQSGTDVMLFVGTMCMIPFTEKPVSLVIVLGGIIGAVCSTLNLDQLVYQ